MHPTARMHPACVLGFGRLLRWPSHHRTCMPGLHASGPDGFPSQRPKRKALCEVIRASSPLSSTRYGHVNYRARLAPVVRAHCC